MSERIVTNKRSEVQNKASVLTRLKNWFMRHKKTIGIVVLVLVVLGGTFYGGYWYGAAQQKKADEKTNSPYERINALRQAASDRIVLSGTITSVSATGLEMKTTAGKAYTVSFDDKTTVSELKGTKSDVKKLKKGMKVIITGTKKSDTSALAQRVRIQ